MASSIESTYENILIRHDDSGLDSEKTVIRQGDLLELSAAAQASVGSNPSLEPASPTDSLLGKQLDHFLIESLIGTGGMGAVFRGRDLRLDRIVAIKVVPIADRGAEAMRRFRFEAQSAAKLDHPHIARVYYVGETELWSYIVFEFVEGTNLRELVVRQGPLSIDDAVGLTRQVAEALQHAFERKVVHRDIKPSNILVTQVGQAKLVDMGLARNTELEKSTNDLTASGVTLGTFDYISPEQAHDPRNADVRSDIYSLGCTLYFLITGHPPFPDGTALQKLLLHGTKLPDDPRYFRSDISDSLISILRKMMAKKPADRYQEPGDLIHDLRTLAELEGLDWAQVSDSVIKLPNASQRTWLEASLPLLISLAAIAGIGVWQWLHSISYQNAVFTIPREEEPQISVPLVDISVRADGLRARDAVELITKPLETIVKGVEGVEHVYSQSEDDRVLVTARFLVGTDPDDAIVRIQQEIRAN
ncbi:MAG: efflux RND transporter permease subunit, partial [Pirellula sp.]